MAPVLSKPIPFDKLDIEVWKRLAVVLEHLSPLNTPGDWRDLAGHLGFDTPVINWILSKQKVDGSCTLELFREYSRRTDGSVEEVMSALEKMKNGRALKILKDVYPVARKEYDRIIKLQSEVGDIPPRMTAVAEAKHYQVTTLRHPPSKRLCPESRVNKKASGRTREGQENSHHSQVSSSHNRGQHIQMISKTTPTINDDYDGSVLPHIGIFNGNADSTQSMEISSMLPQYDSDEKLENLDAATDINHNGIGDLGCKDYVPMEEGLARQLDGGHCDIGAEEEVVTSTTSFVTSTALPKVQEIYLNRSMQSGGMLSHARGVLGQLSSLPEGTQHNKGQVVRSCEKSSTHNTYPRVKQQGGADSRSPCRVASIPDDMKYSEFSEVARQIWVFITYSNDSDSHVDHVVCLAECLKKNKFGVSIDMYEFRLMATDKVGWLETRFKNADFILVCISDQYKCDVEACDSEGTLSLDHSLNTKFIYKLMQTEYHERCSTNYRFIPLLFPGVTKEDVPTWLQNTLIYNWPTQYRDLFFFLSKPDKLINTSIKSRETSRNGVHPTIVSRSYSSESNSSKEVML